MAQFISAQALTKNGSVVTESTVSTLKVGAVTYPNTNGTDGQVLTTNGTGTASWVTPSAATSLNLKADLASPTLTGTPLAPTATAGTNTTQIATTAFVTGAIATAGAAGGSGVFAALSPIQNLTQVFFPPNGFQSGVVNASFYWVAQTVPFTCTLDQLTVAVTPTVLGSTSPQITVTLYINNVATSLQVTVTTSGTLNVTTVGLNNNSVVINRGDTFALFVTQTSTGQTTRVATALRYQTN